MKPKLSLKRKLALLLKVCCAHLVSKRIGALPPDLNANDPNTFLNFYLFKRPAAYTPFGIGVLVALIAPLDVMDRMQWLQPLSDWLRSNFRPMESYVRRSAFPQVTELYFLLMALQAPVHYYYMSKLLNLPRNIEARRSSWQRASLWHKMFVCVIFIPMAIAIVYFALVLNDGFDFRSLPFNTSRVALAIAGWAISGPGVMAAVALIVVLACDISTGKLNQSSGPTNREERE